MSHELHENPNTTTYLALDHLGVGPLPLSLMVFPKTLWEDLALDLQQGIKPTSTRHPLFVRYVADGKIDLAIEELASFDSEPWVQYNLGVLKGKSSLQARRLYDKELLILDELARFTLGETDTLSPQIRETLHQHPITALRALCGFSLLALSCETDDKFLRREVLDQLASMTVGPLTPLTALIQRTVLGYYKELGLSDAEAISGYRHSLKVLEKTDLSQDIGSLHLELATIFHELGSSNPGYLQEAVKCYQSATKYFSRKNNPETFGSIQIDLAVCYLAMPMSEVKESLRYAVAISALREASRIFRKESHPRQWLATQLNLANALIYAPSSHTTDNLVEAVSIYSELAACPQMKEDPNTYAHLMFNWGNAMAHLGDFTQARSRLHEARRIFEEFQSYQDVKAVRDLLDEIERHHMKEATDGAIRADIDG